MDFLIAIVPTAGVLFLFWLAVRAMFQADRRERAAEARLTERNVPPGPAGPAGGSSEGTSGEPEENPARDRG